MALPQLSGAVFLSHAFEDDAAALRVAAALHAAGIEVWLDRSELKGREQGVLRVQRQG